MGSAHSGPSNTLSLLCGLCPRPPLGVHSQPMSMTQMEKIFSELVLGDTLPKPTLVRLLKVK